MKRDRARGALLGLAVGDALGTTYEFQQMTQPAHPELATGPATDIVGGGPFGLTPGAITDDTQMAVCLARSLAERGRFDADDVARRYVAWSADAFDIGNQTWHAMERLRRGVPAARAGREVWRAGGHHAAGNGSLMRTAPIGVWAAAAGDAVVIDTAIADSAITHADPRCMLACAGFDAAIAAGVSGAGASDMLAAAGAALFSASLSVSHLWPDADRAELDMVGQARIALEEDLAAETPAFDEGGFVRTAFRLAFWHLRETFSWREAVVDVASRGGDADTNAAITGALLGARDGEGEIPEAWRLRVLGAKQRGPEAWGSEHHPRHLLALVE